MPVAVTAMRRGKRRPHLASVHLSARVPENERVPQQSLDKVEARGRRTNSGEQTLRVRRVLTPVFHVLPGRAGKNMGVS